MFKYPQEEVEVDNEIAHAYAECRNWLKTRLDRGDFNSCLRDWQVVNYMVNHFESGVENFNPQMLELILEKEYQFPKELM